MLKTTSYGKMLRHLRKKNGITQKQLGEQLGEAFQLKKQIISDYEVGKRTPPLDIAEKFAEYFGVSVDYMLGRTQYPYVVDVSKDFSTVLDNDRLDFVNGFVKHMEKYDISRKN